AGEESGAAGFVLFPSAERGRGKWREAPKGAAPALGAGPLHHFVVPLPRRGRRMGLRRRRDGSKEATMKAPLASFPALRMRRLRQAPWVRELVRETVLTPADLIWSIVVHEGEGRVPVSSMPGVERLSVAECAKAAKEAAALGI